MYIVHSIITEILTLKITNLTEFNRSPSLSYLLDTNEDAVKAQLVSLEKIVKF